MKSSERSFIPKIADLTLERLKDSVISGMRSITYRLDSLGSAVTLGSFDDINNDLDVIEAWHNMQNSYEVIAMSMPVLSGEVVPNKTSKFAIQLTDMTRQKCWDTLSSILIANEHDFEMKFTDEGGIHISVTTYDPIDGKKRDHSDTLGMTDWLIYSHEVVIEYCSNEDFEKTYKLISFV